MATEDATGRLKAAVEGKPDAALVRVSAADVAAVGQAVAAHSQDSAGVLAGALKVVSERWGLQRDDPRVQIHVAAGQLKELLTLAGG